MSVDQNVLEWHVHLARRIRLSTRQSRGLELEAAAAGIEPHLLWAIMRAEMLARPALHRYVEFVVFALLVVLAPDRGAMMTIGPAQVRVDERVVLKRRKLITRGIQLLRWQESCRAAALLLSGSAGSGVSETCRHYNGPACSDNYRALVGRLLASAQAGPA